MSGAVGFDTETKGFDWWDEEQQAFLATWTDEADDEVADLSDEAQVSQFLAGLEAAEAIVAHNLKFDVHQVRATLGIDIMELGIPLHDTDTLSRLIVPGGGSGTHKLKNLAKLFIDPEADFADKRIEELAETMGLKLKDSSLGTYYDVWRAYPDEMEEYAKLDARYTLALFDLFMSRLTPAQAKCYELEQQVTPVLIEAERVGVRIDQGPVLRLREFYIEQRDRCHAALEPVLGAAALGGEGSDQALEDALLEAGIPLHRRTEKTGKLQTNKYALQEFEDDFPLIKDLFDYRTAGKFLTTYIEPMVDREVVHPSFIQCGAWTGRMSCMRPNMQNIPKRAGKEVREMFIPREGMAFVVCDYESIEVRLLAWYMGDAGFRKLIADGHDPHAWMAANIHGGAMEEYVKGTPKQPIRDEAKNTLFAITYGAGAPRISDMNKIPKDQAKALIAKIKSSLPGYYRLQKRIRNKIEKLGYVNTLWGREQHVNQDKAYVGLNALIQGSAADIMKQGLVNVAAAVKPLGGTPLLVVHDEVVVEVPIENAEETLRVTEQALVSAYDLNPPLSVTGSIVTTNYADA